MLVKSIIPKGKRVEQKRIMHSGTSKPASVTDVHEFYRAEPLEVVGEFQDYSHAFNQLLNQRRDGIVIVSTDNEDISGAVKDSNLEPIITTKQEGIVGALEALYDQHKRPTAVVFEYTEPRTNVHAYVRDIYMQQNLHVFRNIPVLITGYTGRSQPIIDPIKVLAVNGSPRRNGDTKRLLKEEIDKYWTGPYYQSTILDLQHIVECVACGGHQKKCEPDCIVDDQMTRITPLVKNANVLLLGSPVYMDLPTARTVAFLSRLTGQTKFNRRAFIGKYATAVSPAWCSGTKAVISSLTNALEMMGFTIQGRSTREYVALWPDAKTRGGVPHDFYWPG